MGTRCPNPRAEVRRRRCRGCRRSCPWAWCRSAVGFPRVGGDDAFARCVFLRLSVWWQSIVGIRSCCLSWDTPTGSRSQRSLPPPHPNGDGACCTSTGTPAPPLPRRDPRRGGRPVSAHSALYATDERHGRALRPPRRERGAGQHRPKPPRLFWSGCHATSTRPTIPSPTSLKAVPRPG